MTKLESLGAKSKEAECSHAIEEISGGNICSQYSLGQRPPVTSANLAFSSRWKGENVATTEVADIVGLVDFVEEVNVYGVSVPGMHKIL